MRKVLAATIAGLLLAACGNGDSARDQTTTLAAPTTIRETTITQIPTTTTPVGGLPEALPGALETALAEDLRFHDGDERFDPSSGYMDVIAPVAEGPWPTVVVFHGEGATKDWHRPDATMLAEQGRVVFLPNWSWTDVAWRAANGTRADFELIFREAACALVYAKAHAAEFGGDPDHIVVYGYSAGGNAALMAGLAGLTPVEICAEPGEVATPQAVVAIDADWLVAPPQWDSDLIEDPDLFYVVTPYRALDGSHGIPVHTMSTEEAASIWERRVPADPAQSWFSYRHVDIDLASELEQLGFLDDGYVDVQEFARYGHHVLAQLGYETTFTVLPNSNHAHWSEEARAEVVERVLHAEAWPDDAALTTTLAAPAEILAPTEPQAMQTAMTEDLIYHSGGEPFADESGAVDVIAPVEGGPWPTVVVFHGDPRFASKEWHRPDAQLIAEQGRVVFLPAWGHFDPSAVSDLGGPAVWEMEAQELSCAVLFARANAEAYGGDPDNITLYGLSAGGNAVLSAGLAHFDPLRTCSESGGPAEAQALVPIDADWTLGGGWDTLLRQQPELFYLRTPWRHLDGSQDIPIRLMVPEHVGAYTRYVGPEPETSWLSYRHPDIDLVADLDARGYLADGKLGLKESNEYALEILLEIGYDATLTVMPDATHEVWGEQGTAAVVEMVVAAGER